MKTETTGPPITLTHPAPVCAPPVRSLPASLHPVSASLLASATTFRPQWLPGSPSPPGHMSPSKTAQKSPHAATCRLSSLWHFPLSSRMSYGGLSIGCNGGRDALASELLPICTTTICGHFGSQAGFVTLKSGYARSSVYRTSRPVTSQLSLRWVSCFWHCPSAYSHGAWSTSWPPTGPLPQCFLPRFNLVYSQQLNILLNVLCTVDLRIRCLPGSQHLHPWQCLSVPGPSGSQHRGSGCGGP